MQIIFKTGQYLEFDIFRLSLEIIIELIFSSDKQPNK